MLAVSADAEKNLEARVLAQCWKPFGKAQQICCEQIEITARPQTWPNVGPTLVGLTVADLPVIFWCRHKGALSQAATKDDHAGLEAITSLATKIVIDTRDMPTAEAITLLERWQARGRVVADLEWTRLTPWREPLAHVFDVCESSSPISTPSRSSIRTDSPAWRRFTWPVGFLCIARKFLSAAPKATCQASIALRCVPIQKLSISREPDPIQPFCIARAGASVLIISANPRLPL